jgi:hypothetical protein
VISRSLRLVRPVAERHNIVPNSLQRNFEIALILFDQEGLSFIDSFQIFFLVKHSKVVFIHCPLIGYASAFDELLMLFSYFNSVIVVVFVKN